ncbi:MAG: hypothetical protein K0S35_75 [Geminicoccaceae bacterium]|jgi:hypothetical protein|nr:hypothetical protein [Geminicoccaceae bacterium]
MADRIVDLRDGDDEPRPEGAEDPDYLVADRPFAELGRRRKQAALN